uniref:alpha/beta hydrolase n=1 Tax=Sandarakinorhabdus rubra TaxID=2672568 RepID=UPI001969E974
LAGCAALAAPGVAEAITVPLLALVPAEDQLVDSAATQRLVARMPNGQCETIPGAAHELLREAEPLRSNVFRRILTFLSQTQ